MFRKPWFHTLDRSWSCTVLANTSWSAWTEPKTWARFRALKGDGEMVLELEVRLEREREDREDNEVDKGGTDDDDDDDDKVGRWCC